MHEVLPNIFRVERTIQAEIPPTTRLSPLSMPFFSSMSVVKVEEETILLDPFLLPEAEKSKLERLGKPTHILIGGEFHARDAETYRQYYGAKILAHPEAVPRLRISIDGTFGDGQRLPGGLTAITMSGTRRGETIFRLDQGKGVLFAGDALMNLRPAERGWILRVCGFPAGFSTMPRHFMLNKERAAASYQKLLGYDFDQILVSVVHENVNIEKPA